MLGDGEFLAYAIIWPSAMLSKILYIYIYIYIYSMGQNPMISVKKKTMENQNDMIHILKQVA